MATTVDRLNNGGVNYTVTIDETTKTNQSLTATNSISGEFDEVFLSPGSIYFNGTSDYLTANTNGTGTRAFVTGEDFTIEFWVNPYNTGTNRPLFDSRTPDTANLGADIYLTTTNTLSVSTTGPFVYITGTTPLTLYNWNHVALVRSNTVMRLYLNGTLEGSAFTPADATQNFINSSIRIGYGVQGNYFNGYISNYRIVQKALYTSAFTPKPTQMLPVPIKSGLSNAVGSVYMPSGAGIFNCTATSTVWKNIFTVEFWVYLDVATYPVAGSNVYFAADFGAGGNASGPIIYETGDFIKQSGGGFSNTGAKPLPRRWNHLAFVSQGTGVNQFSFFLNGVLQSTGQFSYTVNGGQTFGIGSSQSGTGSGTRPAYYSNFRIVQGLAVYTSNFTPPTGPLTMPTGYYGLLLNFNQGSNYLVDANTTPATISATGTSSNTANPFDNQNIMLLPTPYGTGGAFYPDTSSRTSVTTLPTSSAVSTNYYPLRDGTTNYPGSVGLNGSSQYLSAPSSTAYAFGSGVNFTIEAWIFMTSYSGSIYGSAIGTTNGAQTGWMLNFGEGTDRYRITSNASGTWTDNVTCGAGGGIVLNTWTHVAMVRSGANLYLFKNGIIVGSIATASAYNFTAPSNLLNIGYVSDGSSGTRFFPGYISNVRVVNGTALYTSNFSVPTTAPILVPNTVLLLNTRASSLFLTDSNTTPATITNTGSVTANAFNPFVSTTGSVYFEGVSSYYKLASSFLLPTTTTPFTIEAWVNPSSFGPVCAISFGDSGSNPFMGLGFTASAGASTPDTGGAYPYFGYFPGTWQMIISPTPAAVNTWIHMAAVFNGTSITLYVNGANVAGGIISSYALTTGTNGFLLGRRWDTTGGVNYFNGYISNFRVVKGVAVYTGNFTPSSKPLTATQITSTNTAAITGTQTDILLNTPYYPQVISSNSFTFNTGNTGYSTTVFGTPVSSPISPVSVPPVNKQIPVRRISNLGTNAGAYGSVSFNGTTQSLNIPNVVASDLSNTSVTITNGNSVTASTLSPFTNAYSLPKSLSFNGTNQYISAPANPVYAFNLNDFTVEAWIYLTTTAAAFAGICQSDPFGTRNTNNFELYLADNPVGRLVFSDGFQTNQITIPFVPTISTWYHVAVTRQNGTMRMFVNGVSGTLTQSGGNPGTVSWNQNGIVVGYNSSNGGYFPGYITNVRVANGVAVYTGNFTPPTTPLSITQNPGTPSSNISAVTGTQTSFLLNTPNMAGFNFGTGNFTIELWAYPTASTWTTGNFYFWDINTGNVTFQYYLNQLRYYNSTIGTGSSLYASGVTLPSNTWSHIAICKLGNITSMYRNGVIVSQATNDTYNAGASATVYFGTSTGGNPFVGNISNIRVVKGVAVYTGNFTVPTAPLNTKQNSGTNISAITEQQTSMLLNTGNNSSMFSDSSINNVVITNVASANSSFLTPFNNYPKALTQTYGFIDEVTTIV